MISIPEARCIAKICCDGYLYPGKEKTRPYIRYNNTCLKLLKEFQDDLRSIFGNISLTKGITNTNTPFLQSNKRDVVEFFMKFLPDFRSSRITIPDEVKQAGRKIQAAFLRSAFDDEGSVLLRVNKAVLEWKRGISLSSKSMRFLRDVRLILNCGFLINTNHIVEDRDCHILQITGRKNIQKFATHIGFSHPIKAERLALTLRTYCCASPKRHPGAFKRLFDEMIDLRCLAKDLKENARTAFLH